MKSILPIAVLMVPLLQTAASAEPRVVRDITYATVGQRQLVLDLYLPEAKAAPLIVWVHGGAWRAGSKADMPLGDLVKAGYGVASVDYRLSTDAAFPAQVHDIKAAIRFLRAKSKDYGYDADQIVVAGNSAGGHLAALVGVSGGVKELEGDVGDHREQSSAVRAIVSYYGMSNLTTILDQSTPHGLKMRVPALQLLLGGQPSEKPELARLASPVFHVDANDPPLLLLHGDQDPQAPINQSIELWGKYEAAHLRVKFQAIAGVKHGGKEFFDADRTKLVLAFLAESLGAAAGR
ncbi:alpha/beta hydrolase [Humisphaera borealis]|nr:alpha/beta hydrolase [Humisphaera borealis]